MENELYHHQSRLIGNICVIKSTVILNENHGFPPHYVIRWMEIAIMF